MGVYGKICSIIILIHIPHRTFQERSTYLRTSLAWAKEAESASTAELDRWKRESQEQKTKVQGLVRLLQERIKNKSEQEQAHDAETR